VLQFLFAGLIIGITLVGGYAIKNKRLNTAFIFAMAMLACFSGPPVLGRDWYYEGFPAGMIMGSFFGGCLNGRDSA